MRILLFLSTIVAIATPTRADADSCPRGYEAVPQYIPSTFDGIQWRVCAPITDAKSCQSIDAFEVCEHGLDFIIFSHLAACRQRVDVLNERCEAGKALEHHLAVMEEACGTGRSYVAAPRTELSPEQLAACKAAIDVAQRASRRVNEVHDRIERVLQRPAGGFGGRGLRIKF